MPRPKPYGTRISIGVRLPDKLYLRLHAEAERREVSANWLIERALERTLPAWEAQDLTGLLSPT